MKLTLKHALTAIILVLSFAAPVAASPLEDAFAASPMAAGPFEDATAAFRKGDYATALRLFRPLADQGYAPAQYILGVQYALGQGVPKDFVRVHMWFNLAAAQGDKGAVLARDAIAQGMTPAQIAEAQKLAREWKPTKQPSR
jgi:TPR repeat protein